MTALSIQTVGALLILVSYATQLYTQDANGQSKLNLVNNLIGSSMVAITSICPRQWGAVLLEGTWAAIAAVPGPRRARRPAFPCSVSAATPRPGTEPAMTSEDLPATVVGAAPSSAGQPPPTIGVGPGQTWTAAVLRVGGYGVHGWTIGPTDKFGVIRRELLNETDSWDAFSRYVLRLIDALDNLVQYAEQTYGEVRVGVEVPHVPIGFQEGAPHRFRRMRLCDWIIPRQVASAVLGQ